MTDKRQNEEDPEVEMDLNSDEHEDAGDEHRWHHHGKYTIHAKVIDNSCCQVDCVEASTTCAPFHTQPNIERCDIENLQYTAVIQSLGVVSVTITFDVVVTYTLGVPPVRAVVTIPFTLTKTVVLEGANPQLQQAVVDITPISVTCTAQAVVGGYQIHAVVFLDICIKVGHHQQLIILAKPAPRPPECTVVAGECPQPPVGNNATSPPSYVKRLMRLFK